MIAIKILYYQQYACILITKVKPIAVKYCYTRYCHENIISYYKQQYVYINNKSETNSNQVQYCFVYSCISLGIQEYTQEKVFSASIYTVD